MADAPLVFLQPGELVVVDRPARLKTILGSCVAITMRAASTGLAAMAHCMLPAAAPVAGAKDQAGMYVDTALARLLSEFCHLEPSGIEVKLFGGAAVLETGYPVGDCNIAAARHALAAHGLHLASAHLGGERGRVIEFDTASGDVLVKRLPREITAAGGVR